LIHLGIDSRDIFASQPRGVGKALIELFRHLLPLIPGWAVTLYTNRNENIELPAPARIKEIDIRGDRFNAWERIRLPIAALISRLDLLHCPSQTAPPLTPCPVILTVHDLIPLRMDDGWSAGEIRYFRKAMARSIAKARRIIAVSEFTKKDLLSTFDIPENKVDVVWWGVDRKVGQTPSEELWQRLCQEHGIRSPFFVAFGGEAPRKNVPRILKAFSRFTHETKGEFQLVLLGVTATGERRFSLIMDQLGISKQVILLGYLDDVVVCQLMRRSEALIYTSLYEGFGLPILEAMAIGTPVITSNVTSMPEIAGEASLLVDPGDSRAIADAMRECFANGVLRADLKARGLQRVNDFSWERAARETLASYSRALN